MKPAEPLSMYMLMRIMAGVLFIGRIAMPTPNTAKPFLPYSEQLALLKKRGLIVPDETYALAVLKKTNYYRLSAYSLTLRKDDVFYENVAFDDIMELYNFDSEFRKLICEYTGYVEISARAYIAYFHSQKYGPLGYLDTTKFDSEWKHAYFMDKLNTYLERSKDAFVIHHREDRNRVYPLWVAIEVATFDMVSKLYKNLLPNDRAAIAKKYYGISSRECIENWLQCAVVARNVAAHGGRFYNRVGLNPAVKLSPKHQKEFSGTLPFGYVYAIYKLLPEDRKLSMLNDISKLFRKHPFALPKHLGFPENWQELIIE